MADFTDMIDTGRVRAAETAYASLQLAVRDSETEVAKAEADATAAQAEAQAAADGGAGVDRLLTLEAAVEDAERKLAVARRMLAGAQKRLKDGEQIRKRETRLATGAAVNAACAAKITLLAKAKELIQQLDA